MSTYESVKSLHGSLPSFAPVVPTSVLPYIALLFLSAFFALTFTFTARSSVIKRANGRLPKSKNPLPELGTGLMASGFAGLGLVALFCTLGVYV